MLNKYSINPVFGLAVIPVIKLVKLSIEYQKKPNVILNTLRSINEFKTNWQLPLLNLIPLSFLSYKLSLPLWYGFYPLALVEFCSYKWYWVKTRKEINVIDNVKGTCRIYSTNPLPEEKQLQLQLNTSITKILVDEKNKRMFHVKHSKNPNDYRKLDKGSLERLTQVLKDLNGNPNFESSQENDVEVTYSFVITLNIRILDRQLKNIEHKTGLKKGTLTIDQDKGIVNFSIKKDVSKIYILDEMIPTVKRPDKMVLPFVLGCDIKTGKVIISDLVELNHLLIAGKSKMGKSSTFKSIIESLMYFNQNCAFYMIDFGESALPRYSNFSNCNYVESDLESITDTVKELTAEMQRRRALLRQEGVEKLSKSASKLPYLILTVDEANGFKTILDLKKEDQLIKDIATLYFQGRKYGIYIIMAVQQTSDTYYVKPWKTQSTIISHYLANQIDVTNVSANQELQKIIPFLKTGEFVLDHEGDITKMKGCLTDDEFDKLYQILKQVYSNQRSVTEITVEDKQNVI